VIDDITHVGNCLDLQAQIVPVLVDEITCAFEKCASCLFKSFGGGARWAQFMLQIRCILQKRGRHISIGGEPVFRFAFKLFKTCLFSLVQHCLCSGPDRHRNVL